MKRTCAFTTAWFLASAQVAIGQIQLSEIRIDQPGADIDEYFELSGPPSSDLSAYYYVVIGDGAGGSGVVESVTELAGMTMPDDGFFLAVEESFSLDASADLVTTLNFENGDNVTHLLVSGFAGALGDDLDLDDDGVLDVSPWIEVTDCISLLDTEVNGDMVYCATSIGPSGGVPWHVVRDGGWIVGDNDPAGGSDTPGAPLANLPVEVGEFTGFADRNHVIFRWTTLSETRNAGFIVERTQPTGPVTEPDIVGARSSDVRSEFIASSGSALGGRYQTELSVPSPGIHSYRLVQIDTDGTETVSAEVTIYIGAKENVAVGYPYPNPAAQSVRLSVWSRTETVMEVRLCSTAGRVIRRYLPQHASARLATTVELNLGGIASGLYFIEVTSTAFRAVRPIVVSG